MHEPIFLGTDVKQCKIRCTEEPGQIKENYYVYAPKLTQMKTPISTNPDISLDNIKTPKVKLLITEAHNKYAEVFNKDLSTGYNGYFGKHVCRLNWASSERPSAGKVRVPNYNHALKGLQQELMDDLTDQGVLLIPQNHDIQVQSVCPSFLQRKQRAKGNPEHLSTKDDVRLLINFGPISEACANPCSQTQ